MLEVIPGILEKDWSEIERKIEIAKTFAASNAAPPIHIDIIDGKFTPNLTFLDPLPFKKFTSDIFFELHMMVENPIQYLKPFANAGFKRFLGHIEKMPDQEEFVAQGKLLGEVGLAIDGPTDLSAIKVPYSDLDCVLIMTIKVGKSGQAFNSKFLEKVKIPKQVQHNMVVEVDGGINDETIVEAKNAGATRFISTSFIFNAYPPAGGPQEQYSLLKKCLE